MDTPSRIASELRSERMSPKRSKGKEKISNGGSSSVPSSPEFEFWSMLRNPAVPDQTGILTADELFSDGVLLPLELLSLSRSTRHSRDAPGSDQQDAPSAVPEPEAPPGPPPEPATGSRRWTDIFKKTDKKSPLNDQAEDAGTRGKEKENKEKLEKEKRKKKRIRGGSGSPELNINIWPFSRSRSAGNGGTRPVIPLGAQATRKASSAPCSRSNSAGESKSLRSGNGYKWPSSPGRVGVHVGRSSPIWQPRRGGPPASASRRSADSEPAVRIPRIGGGGNSKNDGYKETKARVLNLNVPANIVSGANLGCRSVAGAGDTSRRSGSGGGGSLFNLRGLFTRKVH